MRDELLLKQLPIIEQRLDKCLIDYNEKWPNDLHYICEVNLRLHNISITISKVFTWKKFLKWHHSKKIAYHLRVKTHGAHEITRHTSNAQEKQYAKEIISLYEKAVHKFYAERAEKFIEEDETLMVYIQDSLGTF
jgi:hypothetical protein